MKKIDINPIILSLILVFNATSIMADDFVDTSWMSPVAAEFTRLDSSGNGLVLPNEASKNNTFNKKTFAIADHDHDGSIDINEYVYYKTGSWPDSKDRVTIVKPDSDQLVGLGEQFEEDLIN